jgi:hypothetical protein
MIALYRCGQKSAALAAYSKLRDLTSHEFGQDPGPEAQTLLQQILQDSPVLKFRPVFLAQASGTRHTLSDKCELSAGANRPRRQGGGRDLLFRCPRGMARRRPPRTEPGAKTS